MSNKIYKIPLPISNISNLCGKKFKSETHASENSPDFCEIEDSSVHATEVIAIWNSTVFNVKHLTKKSDNFLIGENPVCDFWVPPDKLSGLSKVVIVEGNGFIHYLPYFTGGYVTFKNGEVKSFKTILPSGEGDFQIPQGAKCKIDFGNITFLVNSVPAPKKTKLSFVFNWGNQSFTGISFLFHIIFMLTVSFFPPESKTLSFDQISEYNRCIKFILQPQEVASEKKLPKWLKNKDEDKVKEGGRGQRHSGEEGKMGGIKAKKTNNIYGIKGPSNNPDTHMAMDKKQKIAKEIGILTVLKKSINIPNSPFGSDSAIGTDVENALGSVMGKQIGHNFGFGGLGLKGSGRGGGGMGEGTIGLGNFRTIGHGGGKGLGVGYGSGEGYAWGTCKPTICNLNLKGKSVLPISINNANGVVKGSLSKEVIRRIIRQHLNEIRYCYAQQLVVKPDLQGRVVIQFLISSQGTVQMASVVDSTLDNTQVENCVAKAFQRWTFPAPEDSGVVIATYPLMFSPAENQQE